LEDTEDAASRVGKGTEERGRPFPTGKKSGQLAHALLRRARKEGEGIKSKEKIVIDTAGSRSFSSR